MSRPLRVTAVMTHPVQYMAPWFRHIAARRPDLDLTVLYGALPDVDQQGVGFGRPFQWDVPLTQGYRVEVCGDAGGKSFESDRYRGIDVPDIERRIRDTQPDVVLVPGWHSIMQVRALGACRRLGLPALYRGDSTLFSGPRGILRPVWALRTRSMLRRFDGYLSVGAHADRYLRTFSIADPLIVRSPHCVDNDRFAEAAARLRGGDGRASARQAIGAAARDFVVLFAGKFQERKRPLDAVRAVARLGPAAVLLMAGDGPLRDASSADAMRLGVRLACAGFLNQTELPRAFAAADCVLVPSAWESWGLIVNEALASGVPCVVTTGVASAPDLVVEGETGHTVRAGDIDAMAARLADVRARTAAGHDFGPRCQQQAQTCSLAAAADGLATACRRVVSRRRVRDGHPRVVACCGAMVSVYGVERITFELLGALREHGASIHCIVNSWDSSRIADLAGRIGASWTPGHYQAAFRFRGISPRAAVVLAWDVARVSGVLLREVRRLRATHVLIPDLAAAVWNLPALAVLRLLGVSVIARLGNAPEELPLHRFLWGRLIDPVVTAFLPNSTFTAAALAATGVSVQKMRVIGNTWPTRAVSRRAAEPRRPGRIIYVGQLIPPKGCDRLLDAVARLASRGYDVSLDVVGDTERWEPDGWRGYIASLQDRARRPDLDGRIRFLGAREDVPALLAAAVVHCCPSRIATREGFGVVTVEAKAAGIPSVVTPSGALPEIVEHRRDGWVCVDDSVEALVEGLAFFLSDPRRAVEAGVRARESASRFSRERRVPQWLEAFGMPAPVADEMLATPAVAVHSHAD
ncbi:MAG: glycosyltransferase family 4 protein [Vicinamibacterales bacterium]